MARFFTFTALALTSFATPAMAGIPVPLPLAGVTGPIGLGIAALGYVGYRVFRKKN